MVWSEHPDVAIRSYPEPCTTTSMTCSNTTRSGIRREAATQRVIRTELRWLLSGAWNSIQIEQGRWQQARNTSMITDRKLVIFAFGRMAAIVKASSHRCRHPRRARSWPAETYGRQARICDHTPSSTATIGALIGPTSGVVDIAVSIPGAVTGTPRPARPLHRRGATER